MAALDDFRVTGNDRNTARGSRRAHRVDQAAQGRQGQAGLEDEGSAQEPRAGAAGEQVVYRAVHGEGTDIAAGEFQGADHVGVGGKGHVSLGGVKHGAVVPAGLERIAEGREKDLPQQVVHASPAAAVGQFHHVTSRRKGA